MERGGLKKGSITKIRYVLAADRSPMNVGNGLDSSLSSKSDSHLEHSVLQSSTPTRQVRTYFNKLQSKNTKAFKIFSCEMHVLVSCGDWVIGLLIPHPHDGTKNIYLPLSKTWNWFFSPWMSHAHFGQKNCQRLQ